MYQEEKLTQQSLWAAHGRTDAVTSICAPLVQKEFDMKASSNIYVDYVWALVCKDAQKPWDTHINWIWEMEDISKRSRIKVQYW